MRAVLPAVFGLMLLLPVRAHAYIDPTAGGLLLQVLLGGAFGLAFRFRQKLAALWRRVRGGETPSAR